MEIINAINPARLFLLIIGCSFLLSPVIFIPIIVIKTKYRRFVLRHSVALRQLYSINKEFIFKEIPRYDLNHKYDNEQFYKNISCKDYLTYELVYKQRAVEEAIKNANKNRIMYDKYKSEVDKTCDLDIYDVSELPKNRKRLRKIEKKIFSTKSLKPVIEFSVSVKLILTDINGKQRSYKSSKFYEDEIEEIIGKLQHKRGYFYLDDDIWSSICKVERGKVSNKMRFSIYQRDNNRCCMCGRRTKDLEIDHIIPIAKGGKSTYDNLQTLCHRCNNRKGSDIYF